MCELTFKEKIKHLEEGIKFILVPHAYKKCGKPIFFTLKNSTDYNTINGLRVKSIDEAKKLVKILNCNDAIIDKTFNKENNLYLIVNVGKP